MTTSSTTSAPPVGKPQGSRPHTHALFVNTASPIHHLAPEVKVAATVVFVCAVALTRAGSFVAFGIDAVALAVVILRARVAPSFVFKRLLMATPFVAFALFLPFFAEGDRTEFVGLAVSQPGLEAAGTILAKAGLGMGASILLAATTDVPAILLGLRRLGVPVPIVAIAGFAFRFVETIGGELARMRVAMAARGLEPRWFWQARPVATSAGATFVRSYERGERVHAAMLSRGFDGTMPDLESLFEPTGHGSHQRGRIWVIGMALVAIAAALWASGWIGG